MQASIGIPAPASDQMLVRRWLPQPQVLLPCSVLLNGCIDHWQCGAALVTVQWSVFCMLTEKVLVQALLHPAHLSFVQRGLLFPGTLRTYMIPQLVLVLRSASCHVCTPPHAAIRQRSHLVANWFGVPCLACYGVSDELLLPWAEGPI